MTTIPDNQQLTAVFFESGCTPDGRAFVQITTEGKGSRKLIGHTSPETTRELCVNGLSAAEAAEHDAALVRVLKRGNMPMESITGLLGELRAERAGNNVAPGETDPDATDICPECLNPLDDPEQGCDACKDDPRKKVSDG